MDLVRAVIPELTAAERYRLLRRTRCGRLRRGRHHRRARDGRRPRDARPAARARGQRRPGDAAGHAVLDRSRRSTRGGLGGSSRPTATRAGAAGSAGVAKFFIDGVIDSGTGWLYEPDSEGEGLAAVLARPGPVPARAVALLRGARASRCATHATRRPRRARGARRVPRAPAPRRACATGSSTSRRCSRRTCRASPPRAWSPSMQAAAHDVARARPRATTGRSGSAAASAATARSRSAPCASRARRSRWAPTGRSRASTRAMGLAARALRRPPGRARPRARTTTRRSTG